MKGRIDLPRHFGKGRKSSLRSKPQAIDDANTRRL